MWVAGCSSVSFGRTCRRFVFIPLTNKWITQPRLAENRVATWELDGVEQFRWGVDHVAELDRVKSEHSETIEVFIENEAGKAIKNIYDEKTLKWIESRTVSKPYPFPYGFVLGTTAPDGDNVDCFVVTSIALRQGQRIKCTPIGLMEQIEDGRVDHNVLAILPGSIETLGGATKTRLRKFVAHVFEHIPGKQIKTGAFLSAAAAIEYVRKHSL